MKVLSGTGLMLMLAGATTVAQTPSGDGPEEPRTAVQPRVPATLRYLNQPIAEVDFQEAAFDRVMDWIDSLTPMSVVVRWEVLEEAGIERDKPITMRVRNLRLSQVLWLLMNEVAGPDLKLAYRAGGELLVLSTEEDLRREMVLVVYSVSDLLVPIPRFAGPRTDFTVPSGSRAFGSRRQGSEPAGEESQPSRRQDADLQKLIDLIVATVEPDSWVANGGLGTIRGFHDVLVVRNSIRVHQALGGYVAGHP